MPAEGGSERRRSERSLWRRTVIVVWASDGGVKVRAHAETEVVNAHGALLRLDTPLPPGKQVQLFEPGNKGAETARVIWSRRETPETARAGVELTTPSETFWGIYIPI